MERSPPACAAGAEGEVLCEGASEGQMKADVEMLRRLLEKERVERREEERGRREACLTINNLQEQIKSLKQTVKVRERERGRESAKSKQSNLLLLLLS